jgi:hypothetical protein
VLLHLLSGSKFTSEIRLARKVGPIFAGFSPFKLKVGRKRGDVIFKLFNICTLWWNANKNLTSIDFEKLTKRTAILELDSGCPVV